MVSQVSSSPFCFNDTGSELSVKFDNDTYYYTDYYYTYGLNINLILPVFSKSFLKNIFPKFTDNKIDRAGVSIGQKLYTPKNIHDTSIQFNDRPFAATFVFSNFWHSRSFDSGMEFWSALDLGIIGPAAGGDILQQKIHDWINSPEPLGWEYQIANDIIVNYHFYSFYPLIYNSNIKFGITSRVGIGTLFDDLSAGLNFAFAEKQFSNEKTKGRKFKFAFNADIALKYVVYNATMQGGLFSSKNPYTISKTDITKLVFMSNFSVSLKYQRIKLNIEHKFLTKEFVMGDNHNYAGITLGYRIK